jgi:hypothetical protein
VTALPLAACGTASDPPPPAAPSGDAAFNEVARLYLEDYYKRSPTAATYLGIHRYNELLDDYSRQGVTDAVVSARQFRARVAAIDAASLSPDNQLDREQLLRAIDSRVLTLETIRPWARDPDSYSSGLTRTAYIMIKRNFAPAETRLRQLVAREKAMPARWPKRGKISTILRACTRRLPSSSWTGNRGFFETAVASAFPDVTDKALLAEFKTANDAVIAALVDYKKWLQDDVLKRSNGDFAFGEDTFRRKLAADEMIEMPLDDLLAIADRDLKKNQAAFAEAARQIDPKRTPIEVLKAVEADHPPPEKLLATTQAELDSLGRFMTEKHIITIPNAPPARVEETTAVHARDELGLHGHSRPVRVGGHRGVLQHDAAGSEADGGREKTSSWRSGTTRSSRTSRCTKCGRDTTCSFSTPDTIPRTSARSSVRQPTARGGRITASRWSSTKASTRTMRNTALHRYRMRSSATLASSSASACIPGG